MALNRKSAVRDALLEYANAPFSYGVLDCCLFAARVAERITGIDYAQRFTHKTESEAYTYIAEYGDLSGLISDTLGLDPVGVESLEIGDPVLVKFPIVGELIGVFMGRDAICKTQGGTVTSDRIVWGWNLCPKL